MLDLTQDQLVSIRSGGDWDLTFQGKVHDTVKAKSLYTTLVEHAFKHNEPGVFFTDRVERDNNAPWAFKLDRCNPCVVGDTVVVTTDGPITIKELYEKFIAGAKFSVLSFDTDTKTSEFKPITRAMLTKRQAPTIRITVSVGLSKHSLTCTPDHKIYTVNRGYVEAQYLKFTDSLILKNARLPKGTQYLKTAKEDLLCVEPHVNEDVYDIEVEDTHNFFANGLLVHNCGR